MTKQTFLRITCLLLVSSLVSCKPDIIPEELAVSPPVTVNGPIYTIFDQPPVFKGGQEALGLYIMQSVRYPADAQRDRIQGQVVVSFVVTSTGQIADANIKQGIGGSCDAEALRVIKGMPDWTPGQLNNKPVNVSTSLPLNFMLL